MSIEAMKQALEYIEATNKSSSFWMVPASELNKTVNALRQAIAEAENRQWVGLTDAEIEEFDYYARDLVMDIEKALKERNA